VTTALVGKGPEGSRQPVGRLELHCALSFHPRPEACEAVKLRLFGTLGGRRCPLLSIGSRADTDPVRTGSRSVRSQALLEARLIVSLLFNDLGRSAGTLRNDRIRESDWGECC
jgi:hypothetical protein